MDASSNKRVETGDQRLEINMKNISKSFASNATAFVSDFIKYSFLVVVALFILARFNPTNAQVTNFCSAPCGQSSTTCSSSGFWPNCDQVWNPNAICYSHTVKDQYGNDVVIPDGCRGGYEAVGDCVMPDRVACVQEYCCNACNPGDCGTAGVSPTPTPPIPTPTPGGPTPTPGGPGVPTPTPGAPCTENGPYYGAWTACTGSPAQGWRTVSYDCQSGSIQSGACSGTVKAKAVVVSNADTSCTAVNSSAVALSGTSFAFSPSSASQPTPQTQSGSTPVTFSSVVGGTYILSPTVPTANYSLARGCWTKTLNAPSSGEGMTTDLSVPTDADTLTWNVGYTPPGAWVQTGGGNVYGATNLSSFVPSGIVPRVFNIDGAGGYPGLVTYGSGYTFDTAVGAGSDVVSSKNWLVNESYPSLDYYQVFYHRLGSPTAANLAAPFTKPASTLTPYYVVGDMTTSGDWVVGDGETILVIINGNLIIDGKITITGTGFIAFIVNGNISISPTVGGLYSSSTPAVEGVYITSPAGTFATGTSTNAGTERFVGKGTFVAGNFSLQRDLESVGQNSNVSAELFTYNPALLFNMPDSMRELPITWQEVAP